MLEREPRAGTDLAFDSLWQLHHEPSRNQLDRPRSEIDSRRSTHVVACRLRGRTHRKWEVQVGLQPAKPGRSPRPGLTGLPNRSLGSFRTETQQQLPIGGS